MDDLNPITRTERLLDGEDLTPTNREEMFIKRIYDKTQEIPEPVNRKEYFLKKAGEAGGDVTVVPLSVTDNGTYSEEGKAYSPVTVEVSPPEDSYQLKSITTPTSLATFEASAMPMPSLKVSVEAKQDLHGYDKPWVGGAGKNLFDQQTAYSNIDGGVKYFPINVGDGTFTMSTNCPKNENSTNLFFLEGNASSGASTNTNGVWPGHNMTISSANGYVTVGYRNQVVNPAKYNTQVEKGSTATSFEPYSNICPISGWSEVKVSDVDDVDNPTVTQTTTIPLPQTVYGAEVDVVNGVLRITKILYTKTSASYYGLYGDDNAPLFYFDISDNIKGYWDITCDSNNKLDSNYYSPISTINGAGMKDCEIRTQQATPPTKIYFRDDRFTDETSINTWLASNPLQVLCVLATPIIVPLTPTLIKSLDGINNLSVDCGDVIEGEYFIELGGE